MNNKKVLQLEKDLKFFKEQFRRIEESGLNDLKADYNLNWKSIYDIVKESVEDE